MNKKFLFHLMAVLVIASIILTACGGKATPPPTEPPAPEPVETKAPEPVEPEPAAFKACQVTDAGGIDDKSFNPTAWKGIQDAVAELGIEGNYLESLLQTDYEKNVRAFVEEGCDIIVTVGFLLGDATKAGAEQSPEQKFSIVDFASHAKPG